MDVDTFVATHRPQWDRLEELSRRRRLSGREIDELVALYQRAGSQLSALQTAGAHPGLLSSLSATIAGARGRITGVQTPLSGEVATYFAQSLPAALYAARRWWLTVMALFLAASVAIAVRIIQHPATVSAHINPLEVKQLVEHDFADYYSEAPAQDFALRVWTNNALIAAATLVVGVFLVPAVSILWSNAVNLGVVAGLMIGHDRAGQFFGLISPHGMLELTTVFVAAGAGLRLGWSWIVPHPGMTRGQAFGSTARATIGLAMGCAALLALTGVIEAFVTPSGLPTWARVGIGALAEIGFFAYVFVLGRRAFRAGETGDVAPEERSAELPVAG